MRTSKAIGSAFIRLGYWISGGRKGTRMRIRMKIDDPIISISPDYKESDIPMIVECLVKERTSWPNVQMSFGEFFREAKKEGVSLSEAMHCFADEIVPFAVDFNEKLKVKGIDR